MVGETIDSASPEQKATAVPAPNNEDATAQVSDAEKKIVGEWLKRIKAAQKHWKPVFDRMKTCQQIAAFGGMKDWLEGDGRYVVPIINRHINLSVSQLYAKNPVAVATVRRKLLNTVWDGTPEQVAQLQMAAAMGDMAAAAQMIAIHQDIAQAQVTEALYQRMADTLNILHAYQLDEQPYDFKTQIKALVRRTKVNGVGYVKLLYVREMDGMSPETAARYEDTKAKILEIQDRMKDAANPDDGEDEMAAEQMRLQSLLTDLQANPDRVVREQIVYDYPKSTEIILDPQTRHLKSLMGCNWLVQFYDLTADEIEMIYGKDIEDGISQEMREANMAVAKDQDCEDRRYRVYEVQDKRSTQVFTICEGYCGYLKPPQEPEIWLERFYNVFPLVFNEIEHDEEIYPPSDVWIARHMQYEYNRAREALREHRVAARPYYVAEKGRLSEQDKTKLGNRPGHAIVEITPGSPDQPVSNALMVGPSAAIDPALYEVENVQADILRVVGSQEANFGGTSGATATETSIAENSRMSSVSDSADDLDDFLTALARDTGKVLFMYMSKDRVVEIVGPGAAWPDMPPTKRQVADEIALKVRAGSSGRPNQAADLANMERAWPALSMLPGINPRPLAEKYADLLDIDLSELYQDGALSITAINGMAKSAAPPQDNVPENQGGAGADNAEQQPQSEGLDQGAFPAPQAPMGGPLPNQGGPI